MNTKEEKKGIFEMLKGNKKEKKKSSCCGFQIEEISEENDGITDSKRAKEKNSCCD